MSTTTHPPTPNHNPHNNNNTRPSITTSFLLPLSSSSPKIPSILSMSLAMALHLSGYEIARHSILALLTSNDTGFTQPSTIPLALGCVSPTSFVLLLLYAKSLSLYGPRWVLVMSTLGSAMVFGVAGCWLLFVTMAPQSSTTSSFDSTSSLSFYRPWLSFALFVFQNSYVQLLYTQHWSFITSLLSVDEGKRYFAPIAGLSSVASTGTALMTSRLVNSSKMSLEGLLIVNAGFLVMSAVFANGAYVLARHVDDRLVRRQRLSCDKNSSGVVTGTTTTGGVWNLVVTARRLFRRVPALYALFCEVLICESLASLLNYSFMLKLKEEYYENDELRASFSGNFFAMINAASGILQFILLPLFMTKFSPKYLWILMPTIMITLTLLLNIQNNNNPCLSLVSTSFFAIKTMEYSIRNVTTNMVYVSLDYESRFMGKEIISVFANRFGKSFMSMGLFLLGDDVNLVSLLRGALMLALLWGGCIRHLVAEIEALKKQQLRSKVQ